MKYIFNKILIVVLKISFCINVFAQSENVIGKVVDSETLEPLIGVHVKCSNNIVTTNVNGEFTIMANGCDKYISFSYIQLLEYFIV